MNGYRSWRQIRIDLGLPFGGVGGVASAIVELHQPLACLADANTTIRQPTWPALFQALEARQEQGKVVIKGSVPNGA